MGCGSQNRMFDSLSLGTSQDCERLRPPCLQVFVIEHSKEVFRDYAAYVKKVELYKKPLWSCKYTGRGALTFEDALAEEQKALASLAKVSEAVLAFLLRSFQPSIVG